MDRVTYNDARDLWEQAALIALRSILNETSHTLPEAVGMAVECADGLLDDYRIRFDLSPEEQTTMTYNRQEAAIDITGNAREEAERADHAGLSAE